MLSQTLKPVALVLLLLYILSSAILYFIIKQAYNKEAFKRIMCYVGIPAEFKDKQLITLQEANVVKTQSLRYLTIKEICKHIGGKL